MGKVVKGRMEAIRAGSPEFPRYIIEDHQDRDEPYYYLGPDRRWTDEKSLAGLFHDRKSAEAEIEELARRDVMLAPGSRHTLEVRVTTYGDADRFEVEQYLREALELGLRRKEYRKGEPWSIRSWSSTPALRGFALRTSRLRRSDPMKAGRREPGITADGRPRLPRSGLLGLRRPTRSSVSLGYGPDAPRRATDPLPGLLRRGRPGAPPNLDRQPVPPPGHGDGPKAALGASEDRLLI